MVIFTVFLNRYSGSDTGLMRESRMYYVLISFFLLIIIVNNVFFDLTYMFGIRVKSNKRNIFVRIKKKHIFLEICKNKNYECKFFFFFKFFFLTWGNLFTQIWYRTMHYNIDFRAQFCLKLYRGDPYKMIMSNWIFYILSDTNNIPGGTGLQNNVITTSF